jgi:hypothetical protein
MQRYQQKLNHQLSFTPPAPVTKSAFRPYRAQITTTMVDPFGFQLKIILFFIFSMLKLAHKMASGLL